MEQKEVKYIIRLNDNQIDRDDLAYMFRRTICNKLFCGILVNVSATHLYFEMGEDKKLAIIPHKWVEWMAPVNENFKEGRKNGTVSNC